MRPVRKVLQQQFINYLHFTYKKLLCYFLAHSQQRVAKMCLLASPSLSGRIWQLQMKYEDAFQFWLKPDKWTLHTITYFWMHLWGSSLNVWAKNVSNKICREKTIKHFTSSGFFYRSYGSQDNQTKRSECPSTVMLCMTSWFVFLSKPNSYTCRLSRKQRPFCLYIYIYIYV
jgi:hypothetical protein